MAELFVPIGPEEEIGLNAQMVADGYAYHYAQYSDTCPNGSVIARAEEMAQEQSVGVWSNFSAEKP
ncbi:MAG: thermonuclease family protein [Cyanobacteria bacterium P01_H01_bin.58]